MEHNETEAHGHENLQPSLIKAATVVNHRHER